MTEYLTLVIAADRFDAAPGWTRAAVAHEVKTHLTERCDVAGLAVFVAEDVTAVSA